MPTALLSASPDSINLLCSSEPLLIRDWLDSARQVLRESGFEDVKNLTTDSSFSWEELLAESDAMSLFANKKCRIITISNGKPGKAGSNAIRSLCENPPEDDVYIFVIPVIDRPTKNASWFKTLQSSGSFFELGPVYDNQLVGWIEQRARSKSLAIDHQSALFLAERTEGNLLAADQELEKLSIRFAGQSSIDFETIESSVSQSARYNHFVLVEACLAGKQQRALKILNSLRAEGFATVQLRWAMQSTLEQLNQLVQARQQNALNDRLWKSLRIWANKQRLFQSALARIGMSQIESLMQSCATLDRLSKGQQSNAFPDQDWHQVKALVSEFSGCR